MIRLITCAICFLISIDAFAYKENTHRKLSESAFEVSNIVIDPDLLTDLGLQSYDSNQTFQNPNNPDNTSDQLLIRKLIENGSDFEDNLSITRSLNHFYNPINGEALSVGITLGNPSPDWALEDTGEISSILTGSQDYSYKDAMDAFNLALTSQLKADRDKNWGKLFQTLGQVIHHIQDMAQPDHVRNDQHLFSSWYEKYTDAHKEDSYFTSLMTGNTYPIPLFPTAREFWTTTEANPVNRLGVADFTNRNFVSIDTIFQINNGSIVPSDDFSLPAPNLTPITVDIADATIMGSEGQALCDSIKAQSAFSFPASNCFLDFVSTPVTGAIVGEQTTNTRAATYSIFDKKLADYSVEAVHEYEDGDIAVVDRAFTLNEFNFKAAHSYLIPRAVAYSAGLINHFFRSKIDMIPNSAGTGWVIQNQSNEEMQGTYTLYYDYVDPADSIEKRAVIPGAVWNEIIAANSEVVVGDYIVPAGLIRKTLVFNGRIGAENNVVTGKQWGGWSEPVAVGEQFYVDTVATDTSGNAMVVYNTYDGVTGPNLWSRRYTSAGGWGGAVIIDSNVNTSGYRYVLAMDTTGNAMVVYDTNDGATTNSSLWVRRYTPAGDWGSAVFINNDSVGHRNLQVVMDDSGNAMVTYELKNSATGIFSLWSRRYTPTGGWGNEVLIENNNDIYSYSSALTMGANGNAMMTYSMYNSVSDTTWSLWSRRYNPASGWGNAIQIDNNSGAQYAADLGMDVNDNAMVVYRSYDSGSNTNTWWYRKYTSGTGWGPAITWVGSYIPQIDMDSSGNTIALSGVDGGVVSVQHYFPNVGWGDAIDLSVINQQVVAGSRKYIDVEPNGRAVVVWMDSQNNFWSNFYEP